jgi:hypothetical protein
MVCEEDHVQWVSGRPAELLGADSEQKQGKRSLFLFSFNLGKSEQNKNETFGENSFSTSAMEIP